MAKSPSVVVLGLGYVGLPLAIALAKHFPTTGFDVDTIRVEEINANLDRTGEIDGPTLKASSLAVTHSPMDCPVADFYIVTVPTPIDNQNQPDLSIIERASITVGEMMKKAIVAGRKPIIVYESTVYPGVTEGICRPILEEASGYRGGIDFFLGYSPERVNPGDREHSVERITKVVSGENEEVLDAVAQLYGTVTSGGVFRAASIKAAEAAKVIENAQRDINVAFMNEITQIFSAIDLSIWDVLEAARTKWNFLPFTPGLVGGHCISVDPYYLVHRAIELGEDPKVILAGRGVNNGMAHWIAGRLDALLNGKLAKVLILGLTFKEDVPDLRNSKVADLYACLVQSGHRVTVHDPMADASEAQAEYGIALDSDAFADTYDLVILAVGHREYLDLPSKQIRALLAPHGQFADLKGRRRDIADWTL